MSIAWESKYEAAQGQPSVRFYIFSPSRSEVLVQFDPIVATTDAPEVQAMLTATRKSPTRISR